MLALSNQWVDALLSQPETGMGYQIAQIVLKDGRSFERATIVGGMITKVGDATDIPFQEADIESIIVNHGK